MLPLRHVQKNRRALRRTRRLPRRPAVTMALGFLCRDGVVIGADRQVTGEDFTFPECKLVSTKWKNGYGILGYSGSHDTFRTFRKSFFSTFWGDMTIEHDDVSSKL